MKSGQKLLQTFTVPSLTREVSPMILHHSDLLHILGAVLQHCSVLSGKIHQPEKGSHFLIKKMQSSISIKTFVKDTPDYKCKGEEE